MKSIRCLNLIGPCFWLLPLSAQSVSQQVFASAGMSAETTHLFMSGTLGETFIFGGSIPQVNVCQGFQTGTGVIITKVIDQDELKIRLQYFPNPTRDIVTMKWDDAKDYVFELKNALGQTIATQATSQFQNQLQFDLTGNAQGAYAIFISDHSQRPVFAGWVIYMPD